jgi:hypothetical protein
MLGVKSGRDVAGKALSPSSPYNQCVRNSFPEGDANLTAVLSRGFSVFNLAGPDCQLHRQILNQQSSPSLPLLFQDTFAPGAPWLFKGQIAETAQSRWFQRYWNHDIEAARYPLIHELTVHRAESERTRQRLLEKITLLRDAGDSADPRSLSANLREARLLVEDYENHFRVLERWATANGRDKAISREAALDTAFKLARAQEAVDLAEPEDKAAAGRRTLWDIHQRRRQVTNAIPELAFGLAVLDLNITGPNAVDRVLGDAILETSYQVIKESFPDSALTWGTRTNLRLVNPDGSRLSQEKLLELERKIYDRIREQVERTGNRRWMRFIENYQVNLSAGYEEVFFDSSDVRKNPNGEYELATVLELLRRIDQTFRTASARSQGVNAELKEADTFSEAARTPRLNYGQLPILSLNGTPEGRFFEPLEAPKPGAGAVRLVHSLTRTFDNFRNVREGLANVEYLVSEADSAHRAAIQKEIEATVRLLEETQGQFHDIYYQVTHDLRMPRLVERPFAAERVDAIVGETGGARLLFVELGKWKGFTDNWYGGNQDKYYHEIIYDFYRVLSKRGLTLVQPANRSPVLAGGDTLAIDPRSGEYFSAASLPGSVQLLTHSKSGDALATEGIIGMRDGDEVGFIVGDRDAEGRFVCDREICAVFTDFRAVIEGKYGSMSYDHIPKVGAKKTRLPLWELREYRPGRSNGKNGNGGKYAVTKKSFPKLESDATQNFTGLVLDYVGVTGEQLGASAGQENAKVVMGRRPRWRYFEDGQPASRVEIHYGETTLFKPGKSNIKFPEIPSDLVNHHPEVVGKPILAREQTTLSAGYVAVDLNRGADLETAWNLANNLSVKSKKRNGQPVFVRSLPEDAQKPAGYEYDRSQSAARTQELGALFEKYAEAVGERAGTSPAPTGPALSAELKQWLQGQQRFLLQVVNSHHPEGFANSLNSLVRGTVRDAEQRTRLLTEIATHATTQGGELIRLRDGLIALKVVEKEGLSVQWKPLVSGVWQALSYCQEILESGSLKRRLGKAKTGMVRLYVQQTGALPPPEVLAEARKYLDPLSVFIPEEIYAMARRYRIAPEKVPYFVAGLKADEIRKQGQEAFRGLTYEDLHRLAESAQGQAFLRDPKNALLLRDTLSARLAYQGVPLLTAMLSVFPAEMVAGYLAEKIGEKTHLSPQHIEELKFGTTLYFAHTFNITASGAWEVLVNRAGAAKALSAAMGAEANVAVLRSAKAGGQELLQVGLRSGGSLTSALADGILEKWGISSVSKMGAGGVAWHLAKGVPRVPLQMLRTMGPGYLASRLFDASAAQFVGEDHALRKYGSFLAFFSPEILRLGLGTTRIAASPALRATGGLFTRVGNGALAVAIGDFVFAKLLDASDYERSVQQRVGDRIYDEEVYRLGWTDLFVVPPLFKAAKIITRFLAPAANDWALTFDHPERAAQVREEDRKTSQEMTEFWKKGLVKLLIHPESFDPADEASYQKLDFGILARPVEMGALETRVLDELEQCDGMVKEETLNFVPEEKKDEVMQKIFAYQLQQAAQALLKIDQEENRWAREVFHDDGTLKEGKGAQLLKVLLPSKAGEAPAEAKLLGSRKIAVALAVLDDQARFSRASVESASRSAGILDEKGSWIPSAELTAALSIYGAQVAESKDPKAQEKLAGHLGKLSADYLLAPPQERQKYAELIKCLGVKSEAPAAESSQ